MNIGRFDLYSDNKYKLSEKFSTDSPFWRIENGQIFYIIWDVVHSKYIERKKIKMCMSEQEARKHNCACYYTILESEV